MPNLRKVLARWADRKQDVPESIPGTLGNGEGLVIVPGEYNKSYVMVLGNLEEVFNNKVPNEDGLQVKVGYDPLQPDLYQVLSTRTALPGGNTTTVTSGYAPAIRYQLFADGGGQDPLWVEQRQILPKRIGIQSGMVIDNQPGYTYDATNKAIEVPYQTLNLTAHIPTAADHAAVVLISVSTAGLLIGTKGIERTPALDLNMGDVPLPPADTACVLGAVRVYNGQTAVQETAINSDILDFRDAVLLPNGARVPLDTTNFDHNLSAADTTVQKALDTLDDLAILSNPLTTAGDLIVGGIDGALERIGIGTDGKVLTLVSGLPVWSDPSASGVSDHTLLTNIGVNTHAQIDTALSRLAGTSGTNTGDNAINTLYEGLGATGPKGDKGDQGIQGIKGDTGAAGTTDHTLLTNIGTNTHAAIDTALARLANTSGSNTGDNAINTLYAALVSNATHTGDVTGATALTIGAGKVTLAQMANMATASLIYRKTAAAGPPEINSLATLKTDLGLTGTNSGDQVVPVNTPVIADKFLSGYTSSTGVFEKAQPSHFMIADRGVTNHANIDIALARLANTSGTNTGDNAANALHVLKAGDTMTGALTVGTGGTGIVSIAINDTNAILSLGEATTLIGRAAANDYHITGSLVGDMVVRSTSGKKLLLGNGTALGIAISGGNIGAGTSTPDTRFDIYTPGVGASSMMIKSDQRIDYTTTGGSLGSLLFGVDGGAAGRPVVGAIRSMVRDGQYGISLFTHAGSLTEAVIIRGNGNFGVGVDPGPSSRNIFYARRDYAGDTISYLQNANAGGTISFQVVGDGGTVVLGRYGTTHADYGSLAAGAGYIYESSASFTIMLANASGVLKFATGGEAERMRLTAAGWLGIGTTTPQGKFHAFGSVGGFMFYEATISNGTEVVVIPDGVGDVTSYIRMFGVLDSAGSGAPVTSSLVVNSSGAIYTDGGPNVLLAAVSATGKFSLARTGGTRIYKVSLLLIWV